MHFSDGQLNFLSVINGNDQYNCSRLFKNIDTMLIQYPTSETRRGFGLFEGESVGDRIYVHTLCKFFKFQRLEQKQNFCGTPHHVK